MGFTKAQRLKGLKKQLRNLGYDVVGRDGSAPEPDREESSTTGDEVKVSLEGFGEDW